MAEIIRMPRMSDTMEEGNIVEWLKQEGEAVEPGDVLAEIETDKATMELESYHEGVLLHIGVKEGQVPVNAIIAVIGEEGEDWKAQLAAAEAGGGQEEVPKAETQTATQEGQATAAKSSEKKEEMAESADENHSRIKASPLARKMAEEAQLDLSAIQGSGDGGRIVKKDVESYESSAQSVSAGSYPASAGSQEPERMPVSQMRKVIARRLGESKFTAPHFYLTVEVDMDQAIAGRKRINERGDVKISFNDFVVKAAAMALRHHPMVNSSWMGDHILINKDINIGVAVAVKDGLLVPVIHHADHKGFAEINAEVKDKAVRAKDKKLQPEEMQGNTSTISNLGMFGIEEFTAIINPPDACILAVGGIIQKPVVKNGAIIVGNRMKVTLSCDHRVVDGATGAQFLNTFKANLEEPLSMMV